MGVVVVADGEQLLLSGLSDASAGLQCLKWRRNKNNYYIYLE